MEINIIGVPTSLGCDRNGPQLAPKMLRDHGLVNIIELQGHKVNDLGDVHVPKNLPEKFSEHPKVKNLGGVIDVSSQLYDLVYRSYQERHFPIVIGGDHSLTLGSGSAASQYYDNLGLIWFDAHGDINMEPASPSGNAHGMPCAALMGLSVTDLEQVVRRKVNPKNIFWIGTRDLDVGENALIDSAGLSVYTSQEIKERGMQAILDDIKAKIEERGIERIHFSLDIDGMDPSYTPGTGTAVEEGVNQKDFELMIDELFATRKICSLDFVEFNPLLDSTDGTLNWCLAALSYISKRI